MSHNTYTLPTMEDFKLQAKNMKDNGPFDKLGHAQNNLAQKYGFKDFNAIKVKLKKENPLITKLSKKIRTYKLSNGGLVNLQGLYKTKDGYKTSATASDLYLTKTEVEKALFFIDNILKRRETINLKGFSSYGLRHHAEKYIKHYNLFNKDYYISNGAFIIALDISGYKIKELEDNGQYNLNVQTNYKSYGDNFYDKLKNGEFDYTIKTKKTMLIFKSIDELKQYNYRNSEKIPSQYFAILDNRNTRNATDNNLSIFIFHILKAMSLANGKKFYLEIPKDKLIEEFSHTLNNEIIIKENIKEDMSLANELLNIYPNILFDKKLNKFVIYWENQTKQKIDIPKLDIDKSFLENNRYFHELNENGKIKQHGKIENIDGDEVYIEYDYDGSIHVPIDKLDNFVFYPTEEYRYYAGILVNEASEIDKHDFFPSSKKGWILARKFISDNPKLAKFIINKVCGYNINIQNIYGENNA